jgi:hypothetical protein
MDEGTTAEAEMPPTVSVSCGTTSPTPNNRPSVDEDTPCDGVDVVGEEE